MKFENNWRQKTLENLEKKVWGKPEHDSVLINRCYKLRKKNLKDFSVEDLRIMIGQDIGLPFLIPLAIEAFDHDILAEGDYYEGDLLTSVLSSNSNYWKEEQENWKQICLLFEANKEKLEAFDTTASIKKKWSDLYDVFSKIHS